VAAPGFVLPGLFAGRIEVVDDERGIGARIAARLAAVGADAHAVDRVSEEASGVIFARGLLARDSQDDGIAAQRAAFDAARTLAKRKGDRVLVTLQDTGGDFGASGRAGERAWVGGLPGLVKTAAGEWPDAAVKAIDIDARAASPDAVADRVVAELLLGGRDVEVALGPDGRRSILRHRRAGYHPIAPAAARIRPGSVIVVSGGARGVTATSLASLGKYRPRLALLGRTALVDEPEAMRAAKTDPELRRALLSQAAAAGKTLSPKDAAREAKLILDCREIRANMEALERAGAEVSYHAVDVRSAESVAACVGAIRAAWGPIQGIVHGAGVLADALLTSQTDEQFDRVFGTKVDGLRHLLAATASDPIELLLFFSSVAGRFGNSAQSVYAMANEVLSAVAASERARRPGCVVRSLAWGPWAGGMVTTGLARLFEKAGVQMIALDAGTQALGREAASDDGTSQVVLMNGEPPLTAKPIHGGRVFDGHERFEIVVNDATHPQLSGHRIQGGVVVPAALVVEWFMRAAAACSSNLVPRTCRGLKVLRGVRIEDADFGKRGARLTVSVRLTEADAERAIVEAQLLGPDGKLRYSAIVEMGDPARLTAVIGPVEGPRSGDGTPIGTDRVYSEILFHRGPFELIRSLDPVFDDGASAEVVGVRAVGWPDAGWISDAALVDSGLQVVCVWANRLLGGTPLPTSVGAIEVARPGALESAARCVVRGRRAGQRQVIADVTFFDASGAAVSALRDVEMHLPPAHSPSTPPNGAA
jgi:NADP-dependent 3-hydroxy acid dehydrogenase YdfG